VRDTKCLHATPFDSPLKGGHGAVMIGIDWNNRKTRGKWKGAMRLGRIIGLQVPVL
jgi:hypothetical protein